MRTRKLLGTVLLVLGFIVLVWPLWQDARRDEVAVTPSGVEVERDQTPSFPFTAWAAVAAMVAGVALVAADGLTPTARQRP